jgi:hypothetical protein
VIFNAVLTEVVLVHAYNQGHTFLGVESLIAYPTEIRELILEIG